MPLDDPRIAFNNKVNPYTVTAAINELRSIQNGPSAIVDQLGQLGSDLGNVTSGGSGDDGLENVELGPDGIKLKSPADITANQWSPLGLPIDTGALIYSSTYDAANNCWFFGGNFLGLGGVTSYNVIRYNLDSSSFSTLNPPSNFIGTIASTALALASDGTYLYVGTNIVGHYFWKVNLSTLVWTDLNAVAGNLVYALCLIGTNLYIGGDILDIVCFDTVALTSSTIATLNARTRALTTDGTDLYVGGDATNIGGIASADYLAKLTIAGTIWSSLTPTTSLTAGVFSLAATTTTLYVGANQTNMIGISSADYIAQYDIALAIWSEFNGGVDGLVRGLAANSDVVCLAGDFTHIDSNGANTARSGFAIYDLSKTQWDLTVPTFTFSGSTQCYTALLAGTSIVFGGNQTGFYQSISANAFPSYGLTVRWGGLDSVLANNAADILQNFGFSQREEGALSKGTLTAGNPSGTGLSLTLTGTNMLARIGTVYYTFSTITFTKAAATNWANMGSTELAGKTVQLFTYMLYNSNEQRVNLAWSRIPWGRTYTDFSGTSTNEKYLAGSWTSAPASGDAVELIGRFDSVLSTGAGYTFSQPLNVINKPIYETDWLDWTPTHVGFTATIPTVAARYKLSRNKLEMAYNPSAAGTSNATNYTITIPFTALAGDFFPIARNINNGVAAQAGFVNTVADSNVATMSRGASAAWTNVNDKAAFGNFFIKM